MISHSYEIDLKDNYDSPSRKPSPKLKNTNKISLRDINNAIKDEKIENNQKDIVSLFDTAYMNLNHRLAKIERIEEIYH